MSDTTHANHTEPSADRPAVRSHRRGSSAEPEELPASGTTLTNIRKVVALEQDTRQERTALERFTDLVSTAASSAGFLAAHAVWFALWLGLNRVLAHPFDPYPFSLLTLLVSLEAILLTGFVLMSQDRMTKLADRRAHLDLQVNLLAEQELTAILKVVCRIAETAGVDLNGCDPNLNQLLGQTDVKALNDQLTKAMATVDKGTDVPSGRGPSGSRVVRSPPSVSILGKT